MAEPTASRALELRTLTRHEELVEVEAIQREVWGLEDLHVVPAAQMRAVAHAGGMVAGAFRGGTMLGFAYGFLAAGHEPETTGPGLHSHMLAVRESGRQGGVGKALKWFQREWCLSQGIRWACWTFDPLQAKNARLNLEHLGATARSYLTNFYGPMSGPLGGGQETDRLLAVWQLESARVARLASAEPSAVTQPGGGAPGRGPADAGINPRVADGEIWLLRSARQDGGPDRPQIVSSAEEVLAQAAKRPDAVLRVAVPTDVTRLMREAPGDAKAWRAAIRSALPLALEAGYRATRFLDGAYALVQQGKSKPNLTE